MCSLFQEVATKGVKPIGRAFASMVLAPTESSNPNGRRLIISGGTSAWHRRYTDVSPIYTCGLNDIWSLSLDRSDPDFRVWKELKPHVCVALACCACFRGAAHLMLCVNAWCCSGSCENDGSALRRPLATTVALVAFAVAGIELQRLRGG